MRLLHPRSALACAALLAAAAGCGTKILPPLPDPTISRRHVREDRGPLLVHGSMAPAFNADASEVFFCQEWPDRPSTYRGQVLASGEGRDVYETCGAYLEYASPDGAAEWLGIWDRSAWPPPSLTLRELVHGGADVVIAPGPSQLEFSRAGDAILYEPQGGGTLLRRLDTGEETALPCLPDFAFSPAGDEVVCRRADVGGAPYARLRLADGQFSRVEQPPGGDRCCAVSWTDQGLRFAAVDGRRSVVRDALTGESWTVDDPNKHTDVGPFGFTPDGRRLVVDERECLADPDSVVSTYCDYVENRYVIADLEQRQRRTLASGRAGLNETDRGGFVFSSDGAFVAYWIAGDWYWRPTAP